MILCRADAFPLIENNGLLKFLTDYIPTEFALAEITHCVIFPKYNIMGAEYNFSGAKAPALKHYLPELYPGLDYVYCANKLNDKIINKLKKKETFSLFSISISNDPKTMTALMDSSSLFKNIINPIDNVDTFEITLKRRKKKYKDGFESPMPIESMDRFINGYRDNIKSFKVSQGAIQGDAVNLLHDKLVKTHNMTKTINKTIDSEEAYKIIIEFFETTVKTTLNAK